MIEPYYSDGQTTLYCGDMREVIPALHHGWDVDAVVTDPPYVETKQDWDTWPYRWPVLLAEHNITRSMWCFGSVRMFMDRVNEFGSWHMSQDVVWRKPTGTTFRSDRFNRCHELAVLWYRGPWSTIYHDTPREVVAVQSRHRNVRRRGGAGSTWSGTVAEVGTYEDDGTRLQQSVVDTDIDPDALSVIEARNMKGRGIHPNEKPVVVLDPLIRYSVPAGGTVLDPFAGSGAVAEAARMSGRNAILIEQSEHYCRRIADRLSQQPLTLH